MEEPAYQRLSAPDRTFLDLEKPNTHMHVAATAIFESASLKTAAGGLDIERLRSYVASRLHLIPRYRQRLAHVPLSNHPVWVDDQHFNIHYHVRHTSLPKPGGIDLLKRLSGRIMSQQLDRAKPLWEFWVIEGLDGGDKFALFQKAHHCMIDGISGVDLMTVLMSPSADDSFESIALRRPRPVPSSFDLVSGEIMRRVREPLSLLGELPDAVVRPRRALRTLREDVEAVGEAIGATMTTTSETPFNKPIGPHRRFDWCEMKLADVKAVKDSLGGTVNDVVLATATGAVRRFLQAKDIDCSTLNIRANVPVSVRAKEERGTLGNRIALWMTDLPVDEEDPVVRIERIRRTTEELKHSKQALGAQVLASVSELTASTLLSLAVRLSTRSRPFNLVVTNVPGPQMDLYMLGSRMVEIYPMVNLLENQGLGIALFSYAGKLFWGVLADWELVPDLDFFVEALRESFSELSAAADAAREAG